jgi:pimeloyl-ACP methyl ester carboxylesterase
MRFATIGLIILAALAGGSTAAQPSAALNLKPCRAPGGNEVIQCGRLEVPENWRRPGGRRIGLNIVYLPKIGPGPEQAPVIWLDGGPGIPGTPGAALYEGPLKFHRERRAVVLFDQRGTGQSNPLHCPKTENRSALGDMWISANVTACRRDLEARADLGQYTTDAAARDVDAIRSALGWPKIDLMGLSYGTMLAQAYLKLYPDRVRAAALMGSVPLGEKLPLHHAANADASLRDLFADCRAEAACIRAFPDLAADWSRVIGRLRDHPVTIAGEAEPIRAGPFGEAIRGKLNVIFTRQVLPGMIHSAAGGDFAPFLASVRGGVRELEADGLYLSVTCPEDTRRITPSEIEREAAHTSFGRYRIDQQTAACRWWAPAVANPAILTPVRSNVPVLLMSGGRDATTPTAWARAIAARMPRSRVVVIAAMTHLPDGLANMECLDRIMDGFFAKASVDGLDTSCLATMTPPPFKT